jgi:hypothetical protein
MIQKIKRILASSLFLTGVTVPLLVASPVFATSDPGTCFYHGPDGSRTVSCQSLGLKTTDTDSDGQAVDFTECYEVNTTTSSQTIIRVTCDNTAIGGDNTVNCGVDANGKPVPCITDPKTDPAATSGNCASFAKCDLIDNYINPLIDLLAALVGVAVVISLVIGGIQYGSSGGDSQKVTAAKNRIRNAIIALITFVFLYTMLNFLIPGGLLIG